MIKIAELQSLNQDLQRDKTCDDMSVQASPLMAEAGI